MTSITVREWVTFVTENYTLLGTFSIKYNTASPLFLGSTSVKKDLVDSLTTKPNF